MKLQLRNCVTDPAYKELRQKGSPIFKPVIQSSVLAPNAIRTILAKSLTEQDADFVDSLLKSGSVTVTILGKGQITDMSVVKEFLGFTSPKTFSTVEQVPEVKVESAPEIKVEEVVAVETAVEEVVQAEEPAEEVVEDAAPTEFTKASYTEEELSNFKNTDLRDIALAFDAEAQVANKSKKQLISLIMELQNG